MSDLAMKNSKSNTEALDIEIRDVRSVTDLPANLYLGDGQVVLSPAYVLWLQEQLDLIADIALRIEEYLKSRYRDLQWDEMGKSGMRVDEALYQISKIRDFANYRCD